MGRVALKDIISYSSQDDCHPVQNLINSEVGSGKKWLSSPTDTTGRIEVIFQLGQAVVIEHIDIGNSGAATLEIMVGRSSWPSSQSYVCLLPTMVLMTPTDCRKGVNTSAIRMFKNADFSDDTSKQAWDRLKVVCAQPFIRSKPFGLSFICVFSEKVINTMQDEHDDTSDSKREKLLFDGFKKNDWKTNQASSVISQLERQKFGVGADKHNLPLSRSAKLVTTAAKKMPITARTLQIETPQLRTSQPTNWNQKTPRQNTTESSSNTKQRPKARLTDNSDSDSDFESDSLSQSLTNSSPITSTPKSSNSGGISNSVSNTWPRKATFTFKTSKAQRNGDDLSNPVSQNNKVVRKNIALYDRAKNESETISATTITSTKQTRKVQTGKRSLSFDEIESVKSEVQEYKKNKLARLSSSKVNKNTNTSLTDNDFVVNTSPFDCDVTNPDDITNMLTPSADKRKPKRKERPVHEISPEYVDEYGWMRSKLNITTIGPKTVVPSASSLQFKRVNDRNTLPSTSKGVKWLVSENKGRPSSSTGRDDSNDVQVECPICSDYYPPTVIQDHAAVCDGSRAVTQRFIPDIPEEENYEECPVCEEFFPDNKLQSHVEQCVISSFGD